MSYTLKKWINQGRAAGHEIWQRIHTITWLPQNFFWFEGVSVVSKPDTSGILQKKLNCCNLDVFNLHITKTSVYVCDEIKPLRGLQEIVFCLSVYTKNEAVYILHIVTEWKHNISSWSSYRSFRINRNVSGRHTEDDCRRCSGKRLFYKNMTTIRQQGK